MATAKTQKPPAQLSEAEKAKKLAQEQEASAKPKGETLDITAPRSYRRAGMKFGPQPVTVDPQEIGAEKMKILMDDLVLIIRPTPEPKPEE